LFFATWCKACKVTVPAVTAWAAKHDMTVLAITDEDDATLGPFFALARDFPALVARDPGQQTMSRWGVRNLPSFVLIDGQGRVTSSPRELPELRPELIVPTVDSQSRPLSGSIQGIADRNAVSNTIEDHSRRTDRVVGRNAVPVLTEGSDRTG
jgi:thiol-disulfide isomerase/thioredoxin